MSKNNKPNKLLDFMNVELPEIKRSNVSLTRSNRFTASFGYIYPTLVEEILPSDRVRGNIKTILKSNPTISSIYGSARQSHQAYFVPIRFYLQELDQNFTFTPPVSSAPSVTPFPTIRWEGRNYDGLLAGPENGFINPGSLLEMLEMFPAFSDMRNFYRWDDPDNIEGFHSIPPINAIPLIAYYDIIRNYYFNSQELQMPMVTYEYGTTHYTPFGNNDNTYVEYANVEKEDLDNFIYNVYNRAYSDNRESNLFADLATIGINLLSPNPISAVRTDGGEYFRNVHHGYAVRTFDDDYFVVSLANDYVEALDTSARVNISQSGNQYSFAVSQLQRARQMARHVSRDILGGTNYDDYIYVHFNTKLDRKLNKPYFLGSCSNDFFFEDIYQMAQNTDRELGSRAGKLEASAEFGDFIDFTADEYGYLIVLSSLIPRITYFAGIPKKYLKTSMADLYSPEFDAWGFQGVPALEITAQAQPPTWIYEGDDPIGEPQNYEYARRNSFDLDESGRYFGISEIRKQPAWFEHMTSYDRVHGLLVSDLQDSFSVLHKSYEPGIDTVEEMISTYIHPWEFNYIFSTQNSWYDNFTWQILFDLNIYRPISKQILPSY